MNILPGRYASVLFGNSSSQGNKEHWVDVSSWAEHRETDALPGLQLKEQT